MGNCHQKANNESAYCFVLLFHETDFGALWNETKHKNKNKTKNTKNLYMV